MRDSLASKWPRGSHEMARRKRRNLAHLVKAQMAIAVLKGHKTLAELAQHFEIHHNLNACWKIQLFERSSEVFGDSKAKADETDITTMQAKI